MIKVKIVSNPYLKEIAYFRWNGENWVKVSPETSSSSKLVGEEFTTGFFPFKVKKIVDEIISAYYSGTEKIDLTFAGTEDEYNELALVCFKEEYQNIISLHADNQYLNNARDIISEVNGIFGGLRELIEGSVDNKEVVKDDLERYSEAASDMIPICVFGNVSSGKSSFINALIGNEILPSGDEPITAKVYKITKSDDQNRAFINLSYDGQPIQVLFDEYDRIQTDLLNNPLVEGIKESLESSKEERVAHRVGAALAFINHYGVDDNGSNEQDKVSDLIEIEVPYDEDGILKDSSNKYILFDTPGSNSASNEKHREVLMKAMKNLTNGLPVFVATSDTLDTEDNLKLYDEIRKYEELVDSRFTMIIVNKADKAKLPKNGFNEEQIDDILRQAIPRKMYSFGIYYVSSVMGLGSKIENDGDFVDDNYARIYMTEKVNFSDPTKRFYTQLYRYNILPEQIKAKSEEISADCTNLVYSNSGMYWIEKSIEMFADNYSAYNKCQQSQRFLRKVLEHTRVTIDDIKVKRESLKGERDRELKSWTRELLTGIENQIEVMKCEFIDKYPEDMKKALIKTSQGMSKIELQYLEHKLTEDAKGTNGFLDKKIEVEKEPLNFWNKLLGKSGELTKIEHEIDKIAANELFEQVKYQFNESVKNANQVLNDESKACWCQNAGVMRSRLIKIILQEDDIVDIQKNELSEVIEAYPNVPLDDYDETFFLRKEFEKYLFKIGFIKIGDAYKLNINKLVSTFNRKLKEYVDNAYTRISESHKETFTNWSNKLLSSIYAHVREMNPTLRELVDAIRVDSERIADLENRQVRLAEYVGQIENLMSWKERE